MPNRSKFKQDLEGLASYPKDAVGIETLISGTDDAMYEVKKSGKNQFAYYKAPNK